MKSQFKPGDSVLVDAGLGVMKQGSIQRLAESVAYVKHFNGSVIGYKYECIKPVALVEEKQRPYGVGLSEELAMIQSIMEKKLTPAELKKREEVAKAIERENPDMDMSKKMAIATATAKKVAEETDDEHYAKQSKPMQTAINLHLRKGKSYKEAVAAAQKHVKEETVEEGKSHTVPKTAKEKSLAALAEPKDKITHADVMVGRGVKKEEVEQIDEISKELAQRYHKAAEPLVKRTHNWAKTADKHLRQHNKQVDTYEKSGGKQHAYFYSADASNGHEPEDMVSQRAYHKKLGAYLEKEVTRTRNLADRRAKGVERAKARIDRPQNEQFELDEAMISYSDFQAKIDAHKKAGNQIKDDKYDKKKASYTVIDQEGAAKKITHTDSGVSQQHLGSVKRDDDESSETKSTEKRGRGRPAGSKSGARN